MTDRNKSGENLSNALAEDPLRDLAENGDSRVREQEMLANMTPAQKRFYVSPCGKRERVPVVTKPTREIPSETLAFLRECCK